MSALQSVNWVYLALIAAVLTGLVPVFSRTGLKKMSGVSGTAILLTLMAVVLWPSSGRGAVSASLKSLNGRAWALLILICAVDLLAVFFYLGSLKRADVSRSQPVRLLEGIAVWFLNYFILGEGIPTKTLVLLLLTVVGIVLMMLRRNGNHAERGWAVMGFFGALLFAANRCLIRMFFPEIGTTVLLAILVTFGAVIGWLLVLITRQGTEFRRITVYHAVMMVLAGLSAGFAILCLRLAESGNMAVTDTLQELSLVIAVVLSQAFLKEKMSWASSLGLILITVCGILTHVL